MHIRIGTRGSRLALVQSEEVKTILQQAYPQHTFEICTIMTKGDRLAHIALDNMNDKGVFVKEIEQQLLKGHIDLAVHSMKDMPSCLDEHLCFTKTLLREDARDVLVLAHVETLGELGEGATLATGSKRRKYQLLQLRPDLNIVGIRGNIDTRLKKMDNEQLDGIVLAAAGLHRLHLEQYATEYLDEWAMIPAVAQGAIAIEVLQERMDLQHMINVLCDDTIHQEVCVERAFLKAMDAGCHTPIGARCHIEEEHVVLSALYGNEEGTCLKRVQICNQIQCLDELVNEASTILKKKVLGE